MNRRIAATALYFVIVLAGGWLRFADLSTKPIHADEAVQGWKTGVLIEEGFYRYDPSDHHGPTLYYLAAPVAWLAGERSVADLKVGTLRFLTAVAGLLLVVATGWIVCRAAGVGAGLCATAFVATSPLLVFYSRHFIQEALFVLFGWLVLGTLWLWFHSGKTRWVLTCGAFCGLLAATKETWPLVAGGIAVGLLYARLGLQGWSLPPQIRSRRTLFNVSCAAVIATAVAALLFTSFFTHAEGFRDAWRALWLGANRAGHGDHAQPWFTYLSMLTWNTQAGRYWSEGGILVFALAAIPVAWGNRNRSTGFGTCARFLSGYTLFLGIALSIIPYKTPWLACGFWHGATVLAGLGAASLIGPGRSHTVRLLSVGLIVTVCANLAFQTRQLSTTYSADPRNPYNYVQTSRDLERLPARLNAVASAHPAGPDLMIKVVVPDYWPLPWVLRDFPNCGYWEQPPLDLRADVLLIRSDLFAALPEEFRADLAAEFFGLRDGVIVVMAVDKTLWEKSLPPDL